ncbi:hypothetical protein [Aeromonas allosaccharophila]|uniref:hypothetical protein n=1 Tax=Aeromonas allosaccharophila TaxID=656 RepID=UPI002ADF757F|nr:hypothetical protein [Aeromonas allosaccharophila]
MIDLHNGVKAKIDIEVVEGGDQDTVPFILVGEDPDQIYRLPRQALEAHVHRVRQLDAALDALDQEDEGNPF